MADVERRDVEPETFVPVDSDEVEDAYVAANTEYAERWAEQQRAHAETRGFNPAARPVEDEA